MNLSKIKINLKSIVIIFAYVSCLGFPIRTHYKINQHKLIFGDFAGLC